MDKLIDVKNNYYKTPEGSQSLKEESLPDQEQAPLIEHLQIEEEKQEEIPQLVEQLIVPPQPFVEPIAAAAADAVDDDDDDQPDETSLDDAEIDDLLEQA